MDDRFQYDPPHGDVPRELNKFLDGLLVKCLKSMPDGHKKNCGIAFVLSNEISDLFMNIAMIAADRKFREQQAKDIIEYLSCVKAGLEAFCSQQKIEVRHE